MAPISGILMNIVGIEEGSFISANIPLAEISPDGNLIAEWYISPIDIGFINPKNPVKFQMDAFNYNQWGLRITDFVLVFTEINNWLVMIKKLRRHSAIFQ